MKYIYHGKSWNYTNTIQCIYNTKLCVFLSLILHPSFSALVLLEKEFTLEVNVRTGNRNEKGKKKIMDLSLYFLWETFGKHCSFIKNTFHCFVILLWFIGTKPVFEFKKNTYFDPCLTYSLVW